MKDSRSKADYLRKYLKGACKQARVAMLLGITPQAASYKFKHGNFTSEELIIIFHDLGLAAEEIGQLLHY